MYNKIASNYMQHHNDNTPKRKVIKRTNNRSGKFLRLRAAQV